MVDALYSRQKQQEDHATVQARRRRLIVPLVAAFVLIGAGWTMVWPFGGSKVIAPSPGLPPHHQRAQTSLSRPRRGLSQLSNRLSTNCKSFKTGSPPSRPRLKSFLSRSRRLLRNCTPSSSRLPISRRSRFLLRPFSYQKPGFLRDSAIQGGPLKERALRPLRPGRPRTRSVGYERYSSSSSPSKKVRAAVSR
jgi:hypothetical protein